MEPAPAPGFDLTPPASTQVEPTVRERVPVYDFIRGVAVLGILLANIPFLAGPEFSRMMAMLPPPGGIDGLVEQVTLAGVTGKFRSMLALLFGVGIWLQYKQRSAIPGNWPGGYLKRTAILAGFGLVHGIFIWEGDILFLYASTAFVVCLLAGMTERPLRWVIGAVLALALLAALGLLLIGLFSPDALKELASGTEAEIAREVRVFSVGSYFDQLGFRLPMFAMMVMGAVLFVPFLGALFLLGILLGRHGVLIAPHRFPRVRNRMLWVGFGVGLPLNLLAATLHSGPAGFFMENAVEVCFGPLVAVGVLTVLAMIAESKRLASVQRAVAAVGRMAFSNYILQSVLASIIFYSWGFGLFGKLDRLEMLLAVAGIWTVNLVFSSHWLRAFQFGPLEWLWRSLTEGRRMPFRKEFAAP